MARIGIFNNETKLIATVRRGCTLAKCFYYDTSAGHAVAQARVKTLNDKAGSDAWAIHPCSAQQVSDGKLS